MLQGNFPITPGTSYTVTVGSGGSGATSYVGTSGGNSVFGAISSTGGGGGGGGTSQAPLTGGSGGGAGTAGALPGASGVSGQGNAGGASIASGIYPGGGGGGAGTVGLAGGSTGGNGGAGAASDVSGSRVTYAGGGGGGTDSGTAGTGGAGGGGSGGSNAIGSPGATNAGGGGGGAGFTNGTAGGNGGSGIVILSYPDIYAAAASTTGSPTVSTSGSGSIYFNGSSRLVSSGSQIIPATGDFTLDAWVYIPSLSAYQPIIAQGTSGNAGRLDFYVDATTGYLALQIGGSTLVASTGGVQVNTWTYIAATRTGSSVTLYVNGSSVATGTNSNSVQNTNISIGADWPPVYATAYISNVRVSNVIRTITTPTAPFSPTTANTVFLLPAVSGAYLAEVSSNANTFTVTGAPAWNALSPFATGLGYKNRVYTWTSSGSITF
mgnify:CR=1 FL=1